MGFEEVCGLRLCGQRHGCKSKDLCGRMCMAVTSLRVGQLLACAWRF